MAMFRKAAEFLGLVDDETADDYALDDGYLDDGYVDDGYGDLDEPVRDPRTREVARVREPEPVRERPVRALPERAEAGTSAVTVVRGRDLTPAAAPGPVARPVTAVTADTPTVRPVPAAANVHVIEPRSFNDAQEIGDRLKSGQPVIMNLQANDRELQRRLIDFASGLCYALSGTMSKAADQVFLLTPANVDVSAAEVERISARGLYRA